MAGRTNDDVTAALGVRSHSGWAAYVLLSGNPKQPGILARGRMQLCDPSIEGSKQPFHEAEPMALPQAEKFIARCAASSARLADKSLAEIAATARITACCVLTASGRPLPGLKGILASHSAIHAAEGEFYRDAIAAACERAKFRSAACASATWRPKRTTFPWRPRMPWRGSPNSASNLERHGPRTRSSPRLAPG